MHYYFIPIVKKSYIDLGLDGSKKSYPFYHTTSYNYGIDNVILHISSSIYKTT